MAVARGYVLPVPVEVKRFLVAALVLIAVLPVAGYWLARSRGLGALSADARASLGAPLEALQRQARQLDGEHPDVAAVCVGNAARLRARVSCEAYVATVRARVPSLAGGTLDATSLAGNPRTDAMVVMGIAAVGPHGNGEFSVHMVREGDAWRVADVMRYGRSLFP